MSNAGTRPKKPADRSYSISLIIGLLLVPLSAVAAVALVTPSAEPTEPQVWEMGSGEVAELALAEAPTTTADPAVFEIASADDLAAACGDEGLQLVWKEADESITPLEQAALDSLRAICASEGYELPGPPAPPPIVKTVTVVASPSDGSGDGGGSSVQQAAEFEQEYNEAAAAINRAIDAGGKGDKIREAEKKLNKAAELADSGNYKKALEKVREAKKKADEAMRGGHDDDDDHDDDDHDDDDDDD